MLKPVVIALALLVPVIASAQVPPSTITVREAADLLLGLTEVSAGHPCDKQDDTAKLGDQQRVRMCPYHLNATTILAMGRDIKTLREIVQSAQDAQTKVEEDIYGPALGRKEPTPDQVARRDAEIRKLFEHAEAFVPEKFKTVDLALGAASDQNQIPPLTIARIIPLIEK